MSLLAATIRVLTNARAIDAAIVDGNGDHVTGFDGSRPANATVATVATTTTSTVLFASNAARRRMSIHNDSGSTLYVKFGVTASSTSFTVLVPKNATWEGVLNDYTGVVEGVLASGTGNARVTEITS